MGCLTSHAATFSHRCDGTDTRTRLTFLRLFRETAPVYLLFTLTFLPAGWILRNIVNFLAFYHLIKGMCPKICGNKSVVHLFEDTDFPIGGLKPRFRPILVAFNDTHGDKGTHSRLNPVSF